MRGGVSDNYSQQQRRARTVVVSRKGALSTQRRCSEVATILCLSESVLMSPTVSWSSVSDPCEGIILVMVGTKGLWRLLRGQSKVRRVERGECRREKKVKGKRAMKRRASREDNRIEKLDQSRKDTLTNKSAERRPAKQVQLA